MLSRALEVIRRRAEDVLCSLLLVFITAIIFLQVVMRYVFHAPLSWVDEASVFAFVWFVYLGASLATRERSHIRVLNFIHLLPPRAALAAVMASDLLWLAFNALMVWQGAALFRDLSVHPYLSSALGISEKWPFLAVPVGFLFVALRMAEVYVDWWRTGRPLTSPLEGGEAAID